MNIKEIVAVFWVLLAPLAAAGCGERRAVETEPSNNHFSYAIKGQAAVFHQGPRPGAPDYVVPERGDRAQFTATIGKNVADDAFRAEFNLPRNADGAQIVFMFSLATRSGGFSFEKQDSDRVTMREYRDGPVEAPTLWMSDVALQNLPHMLTIEYDPRFEIYQGQFNFVLCASPAILAATCDRAENQRQVFGHFNVRADTVNLTRVPVGGTLLAPVSLGTAPVVWRDTGVDLAAADEFFSSVNNEYGYFRVRVQAGQAYRVDARSNADPKLVSEAAPFEVFSDADFERTICVSARDAYGNSCVATATGDELFIRMGRRGEKGASFFKLYVYRDTTAFPSLQPVSLPTDILPTPASETISGEVSAWVQVHYLQVTPGQLYGVSLTSEFSDELPIAEFDIYDGALAMDQTWRDCTAPFANGECRTRVMVPGISRCSSHPQNPVCVAQPMTDVLTVVARAQPWAGGLPYRLAWSPKTGRAVDQGSSVAPIVPATASGLDLFGSVGRGVSYYLLSVQPAKTYFAQTLPVPFNDPVDVTAYQFDARLAILARPEVKFYGSDSISTTTLLKTCEQRCFIETPGNTLAITVAEPAHLLSNGMQFYTSLTEVAESFVSEKKTFVLGEPPLEASVGARGSEYTLNLALNAKYRVQIEQPAGPFAALSFAVTDLQDANYQHCRGVYEGFKRWACVFQMPKSKNKVMLRVGSRADTEFAPVVVGSPMTVSVEPADDANIPQNEGETSAIILAPAKPYVGHAAIRGSAYRFTAHANRYYRVSIQGITAGVEFSLDQGGKRCQYRLALGMHALPECLVAASARQTEIYFTVKATDAQASTYTIIVKEDIP